MKNILIVDDDQNVAEMLSEVAKAMGKHPLTAANGREGLKKVSGAFL